jgi:hypothetical protein
MRRRLRDITGSIVDSSGKNQAVQFDRHVIIIDDGRMFRSALLAPLHPTHQHTMSSRAKFALEPVDIGLAFSVNLAAKC